MVMKRILAFLLSIVVLLSLVACGNDSTGNTGDNTSEVSNNASEVSSAPENATDNSTKPTPPPTTPSKDFVENKDSVISETILTTPQNNNCKHKAMMFVPNENGDVPTCTEAGYYLKWCPDCLMQTKVKVEALGHIGGIATCNLLAKCERCQQEYGELDASKHVHTAYNMMRNAITPTCEKDGYEGDILYCLDCDKTLEKGKVLKATGHSLVTRCINGEYKTEEYCKNKCGYSKYTNLKHLEITFNKMIYDGNLFFGVSFYVSGGYGGSGGKYTANCYHYYWSGSKQQTFQKEYFNIKDEFGFYCPPVSPGNTFKITVSDYYGHSLTKEFICIEDPNNSKNYILKETN